MHYEDYLKNLHKDCDLVYAIANEARSKGLDPKLTVEIPQAHDLADRTQKLLEFLHSRDTAEQIRELTISYDGNREMVAIDMGRIVAAETYLYGNTSKCPECKGKGFNKVGWREEDCRNCESTGMFIDYDEMPHWKQTLDDFEAVEEYKQDKKIALSIYHGVCAGLAVLTEGILVAPLEGVVSCRLLDNANGTKCVAISFAGPIRSAGGTGQALSVLIADILRRMFGFAKVQITNREVERYKEEVGAYARGLQYRPGNPQIETIAKNCPIYIDGEGVGGEVSGQRDLPRVPTNKTREGAILVMCEGLVLKAPKILKYVEDLKLDGWSWLSEFVQGSNNDDNEIKPSYKFLGDILAGRPIFGQPMQVGGFRLRYGRSRLGGLATTSIHPATMKALGGFLITGTQMKYERPGKATVVTPCTTIEGPYVQFKDGSAKRIQNEDDLPDGLPIDMSWPIEKIWDLGEILVPVGEFVENNHNLMPSPYIHEWHKQVVPVYPINFFGALKQCADLGVPMAPEYVAMFNDISAEELKILYDGVVPIVCGGKIKVAECLLDIVYRLNIEVVREDEHFYMVGDNSAVFINTLKEGKTFKGKIKTFKSGLQFINTLANYEIRPKVTYRIGGRMGKPEGAKLREMKPAIHVMSPLGHDVGAQRKIVDAIRKDTKAEVGERYCDICDKKTLLPVCCKQETTFLELIYKKVNLTKQWTDAKKKAGIHANLPVKGVKGMTSAEKAPEPLLKGILRYQNDISVFRDGTIRFDMVDITMTHFKPAEIGLNVEMAKSLGYEVEKEDEIVELFPQDIVISKTCAEVLLKTTHYVDDLLVKMYGMKPFYNCKTVEDMFGHLLMGLAPHTSGAILCRLIGVAEIKGHYGHPFFHAGKRRNCDGDIDCIMLLTDGLINFSKSFLSTHRGGQMDAPLILTTQLNPSEIDKEALNLDISSQYPIKFYEATQDTPKPQMAKESGVEFVKCRLGSDTESRGFGFTHDTDDCSDGPKNNPYNTLDSMRLKTMAQFALGTTLYSVDNKDQSSRLIDRHLIRDMRGNLRAYGQQKVRCTKCGTSYRRPPITGECNQIVDTKVDPFTNEEVEVMCPGNLILTVTKGSVAKYDGLMNELVEKYGCNEYIKELYHMVSDWVAETFREEETKAQQKLW